MTMFTFFFTIIDYINMIGGFILKKKFDKEYRTEFPLEVCFLSESGIPYEFVKTEHGITVWKYKKTEKLGKALAEFWKRQEKKEREK